MPITIDDVRKHLSADENAALDLVVEKWPNVAKYVSSSLDGWMIQAFTWMDTAQGDLYWRDVYNRLAELDFNLLIRDELAESQRKLDALIESVHVAVLTLANEENMIPLKNMLIGAIAAAGKK